jgi:hypothetical protein
MQKRAVIFGNYNTAAHGWTLTGLQLSSPKQKTNYVDKSGGDGSWDLSTILTDGIPRYDNRELTVTLECSKGTRADREDLINEMVNLLDGFEWEIRLPDRPGYYLQGRIHIEVNQNRAYAEVVITGTCSPWLYRDRETVIELTDITAEAKTYRIRNSGRRAVTPRLTASEGSVISLQYGGHTTTLGAGLYEWSALLLKPGDHVLEYWGTGSLTITYREAVLR